MGNREEARAILQHAIHLNQSLFEAKQQRQRTIKLMYEIAKDIDNTFINTEVAKASGNAGAVLASGLSVAGGTFLITTGVGAPAGIGLVAAGMGLGLTSGFTKVGASVVSK